MTPNIFQKAKEIFLDACFPRFCENCGKEGSYLCEDCFYLIDIFENCYCPFCQKPNITLEGATCRSCKNTKKLDGLFSATSYENPIVKKMIIDFKYGFTKDLSKTLSFLIIAHLLKINKLASFKDYIIIPVPLSNARKRERGFNQSELISRDIAPILKAPVVCDLLVKTKNTKHQADLEKTARLSNLALAFDVKNKDLIKNKNILLVDDVLTTGATLEECARTLKKYGSRKVWAIVIARA